MYYVQGKITDFKGKPLGNVNITLTDANGEYMPVNGVNVGRPSDSNGKFAIPVTNTDSFVTFSAVGYTRLTIPAESAKSKTAFKLQTNVQALDEVAINTGAPRPRAAGRPAAATQVALASVPATSKKMWYIIGAVAAVVVVGSIIYFIAKKK